MLFGALCHVFFVYLTRIKGLGCILYRIGVILVAFMFSALSAIAQNQQRQADSLLRRVEQLADENPEAMKFALEKFEQLAGSQLSAFDCLLMQARAMASLALGLDGQALQQIDSAIVLAQRAGNERAELFALLKKAKLCHAMTLDEKVEPILTEVEERVDKQPNLEVFALRAMLQRADMLLPAEALDLKREALKRGNATHNDTLIALCAQSFGATLLETDDYRQALVLYAQALQLWKSIGNLDGLMEANRGMGLVHKGLGNFDSSWVYYQQALDYAVAQCNISFQADLLNKMGALNLAFVHLDEALRCFEHSYTLYSAEQMSKSAAAVQINIARTYARKREFSLAMERLGEAIEAQQQLGDIIGEAEALNEMGNLKLQQNLPEEALRYYLRALVIRTNHGNKPQVARSSVNIGLAYRAQNMLGYAAKYLEQAVALMDEAEAKPAERVYALQNLAIVYGQQRNHGLAIATYQRALTLAERMGDGLQTARLLRNLAQAQRENGQTSQASASLNRALQFAQQQHSVADMASVYNEQGNVARLERNYQQSIDLFQMAAKAYSSIDDALGQVLCERKIGEVYAAMGLYPEAEHYLTMALEKAQVQGNAQLLQFGHKAMYELYNSMGKHEQALRSHVRYSNIRDSLDLIERTHREERFSAHASMELNQKDTEIRAMEAELENARVRSELDSERIARQTEERKSLIIIMFTTVLLAVLLVVALAQKRRHARALEEHIVEVNLMNNRLNQSELELRTIIRSKDKLFSVVAHDLRGPISGLTSLTKLMENRAEGLSVSELRDCSHVINSAAENVLALIENLLHWTRSQTGRLKLHPEALALEPLLNEIMQTALIAAQTKGIAIAVQLAPRLSVYADPDTLKAAIRNLVNNAIKFTPAGGEVSIKTIDKGSCALIDIADTGVGMTAEQQQLLFDLDMRSTPGTDNEAGTGLGLLVCKEFVECNHGRISVSSSPGCGTTFSIELPKV